jgi:hypothetical protein
MPYVDTKELVYLGNVLELGYSSDKWDKRRRNYKHEFEKKTKLFCTPDGKNLILNGAALKVLNNGING